MAPSPPAAVTAKRTRAKARINPRGPAKATKHIKAINKAKSAAKAAKAKACTKGALKQCHFKILLESSTHISVADGSVSMTCNANGCNEEKRDIMPGQVVLLYGQPGVNIRNKTSVSWRHFHWGCTSVNQRARFHGPCGHKLNGITSLPPVIWEQCKKDIAEAAPKSTKPQEDTDRAMGKLVRNRRRRAVKQAAKSEEKKRSEKGGERDSHTFESVLAGAINS